jgi:hypothetical protein
MPWRQASSIGIGRHPETPISFQDPPPHPLAMDLQRRVHQREPEGLPQRSLEHSGSGKRQSKQNTLYAALVTIAATRTLLVRRSPGSLVHSRRAHGCLARCLLSPSASGTAARVHAAWRQTRGRLMLARQQPGDGGRRPSAWHAARVRMDRDSRAPPPIAQAERWSAWRAASRPTGRTTCKPDESVWW